MEDIKPIKLRFLGETGTGKTEICNVFSGIEFRLDGLITIGNNKFEKIMRLNNNKDIKLIYWDTGGNERFKSSSLPFAKNVDGIVLVFDFINRKSFDALNDWLDFVKDDLKDPLIILFGNKTDIDEHEWKITSEEVKKFAKGKGIAFFEVSAKTGKGINEGILYIANEIYDKKYGKNKTHNEIFINNNDIINKNNKSDCVRSKKNK